MIFFDVTDSGLILCVRYFDFCLKMFQFLRKGITYIAILQPSPHPFLPSRRMYGLQGLRIRKIIINFRMSKLGSCTLYGVTVRPDGLAKGLAALRSVGNSCTWRVAFARPDVRRKYKEKPCQSVTGGQVKVCKPIYTVYEKIIFTFGCHAVCGRSLGAAGSVERL